MAGLISGITFIVLLQSGEASKMEGNKHTHTHTYTRTKLQKVIQEQVKTRLLSCDDSFWSNINEEFEFNKLSNFK